MGFFNCINKLFLVALNFVVFLVGGLVVALASVVIHKTGNFTVLLDGGGMVTVPIQILILGIFITLLGFLGCCGAMQESACMLYTYATLVLIFFVAEIVLALYIFLTPYKAEKDMQTEMKEVLERYDDDPSIKELIDVIQHDYKCCGVIGSQDWDFIRPIPSSCCDEGFKGTCYSVHAFKKGCFYELEHSLHGFFVGLGIAALVLAIIQVASITIAFNLAKQGNSNAGKVYRRSQSI